MRRHIVLLAALLTVSLQTGSQASQEPLLLIQEDGQGTPAALDSTAEPDAPDRRRILQLKDGSYLRARTRSIEGVWQQRIGPDWVALDRLVRRARLERELLAEARRMEGFLNKKDPASRVVLARWMIDQGLQKEALRELDGVLEDEPDYAQVLRLLQDRRLVLPFGRDVKPGTPAYVNAVVLAGCRGAAATRELATRTLSVMASEEGGRQLDLDSLIKAELVTSASRRRSFATHLAKRLRPGEFLVPLCDRAILDKSSDTRRAAAEALAASKDVAVVAPMLRALGSEHPAIRSHAAAAIGTLGFAAAVEPMVAHLASLQAGGAPSGVRANLFVGLQTSYVRDYDVEIAQAAAIADPIIGVQSSGVMFDVRATAQITQVAEMRTTIRSLQKLTGASPGNGSPAAWSEWWQKNQRDWRAADHFSSAAR